MLCDQLMMIQYLALVLWEREGWGGGRNWLSVYRRIAEQRSWRGGRGLVGDRQQWCWAREYKVEIETGFLEMRSNLKL